MIFSIIYYVDLHSAICFTVDVFFYQVKLLLLYNVQTTSFILLVTHEIYITFI